MSCDNAQRARPTELGLMFTHRCPLECRHCGILSGPNNRLMMDQDLARRCIIEAAQLDPRPVTIVFTGGEPMMYPDRLEELLELANGLGLATRVITSGFWAKDRDRAVRLLHRLRLAGLDALNFSADKYHLEFMPASVLRQAFDLCRTIGYPIIVNMVLNRPGDPVAIFSDLYGIDPDEVRLFDEEDLLLPEKAEAVAANLAGKINLSYGRLVGHGRAADYPEEHLLAALDEFAIRPCLEVVNRPVVYPDGALQACCCAGGKIASFTVGNLAEASLADLFERMRRREHFRLINRLGPRALFEIMAEVTGGPDPGQRHASICDVCIASTKGVEPASVDMALEAWGLKHLVEDAL